MNKDVKLQDNLERAEQAYSKWPSWKKDFLVTKYSSAIKQVRSDSSLKRTIKS